MRGQSVIELIDGRIPHPRLRAGMTSIASRLRGSAALGLGAADEVDRREEALALVTLGAQQQPRDRGAVRRVGARHTFAGNHAAVIRLPARPREMRADL